MSSSASSQSSLPPLSGSGTGGHAGVVGLQRALAAFRRRRRSLSLIHQSSLLVGGVLATLLTFSVLSLWLPLVFPVQLVLFLALAGVVLLLIRRYVTALRRLTADDSELASLVEAHFPDLEQRLLTSLEFGPDKVSQPGVSMQFVEQLWTDAGQRLRERQVQLEQVADQRGAWMALGASTAIAILVFVSLLSSDALRRASGQVLWPFSMGPDVGMEVTSQLLPEAPVELTLSVEPGDVRMQRGQSLTIITRVEHGQPDDVQLRMQSDQVNWHDANMRSEGSGSDSSVFSYYMPSVQEDFIYYVSVEGSSTVSGVEQRTRQFRVSLYDLPRAENIQLSYTYPAYTGMEDHEEDEAGDIAAPEGTEVAFQVTFNKPVQQASILFDDDTQLPLEVSGLNGSAVLTIDQDRSYSIVATDLDRLETEDPDLYYITAIPDEPPTLVLHSPGRDQDVMPLEEVVLEVEARDDYGLSQFTLHYSRIGADEVAIDFLPEEQTRNIVGNQLLYLEDLGVQPGDFISYYMTLADNNGLHGPQEIVSDIYFLQVIPTDQEFRRAAGGGNQGGGGGGDETSSALVTLQKDIIAATWRLRQQQLNMDQQQFSDDVAVLADSQREAMQRARRSIDRLSERLNFADDSYGHAVAHLQNAIAQMEMAAAELEDEALTRAMQPEQQALQFVLRAESEINRTDVNFQRTAGGGGGGGQQESEDLRELFEMEMGQNENRYETPRQAQGGNQQTSEEASRLEELARRQENLTRAQRNMARRMDDMSEEQRRRELERLRREQEQLSNELAQLQQQMSRRQQSQQLSQSGSSSGSQAQGDSTRRMEQALEQMREAAQSDSPAQAAARSQRALESLREQQRQLSQTPNDGPGQLAQNLAQRGQALLQQQRELQQQLQELVRQQGVGQSREDVSANEQVQGLVNQQQRLRQELDEVDRMLRAVIARAGDDEQRLLSQAQQASRSMRPLREQMDTSQRVLQNGMVNLAVDIEREIADTLGQLDRNLQALAAGSSPTQDQLTDDPLAQAVADASELRQQLEALQEQIGSRQQGQSGDESISELRQRLSRSQQLAQDLTQRLDQAASGGQSEESESGRAQQGAQGQQQRTRGDDSRSQGAGIPEYGEAALWGNARSIRTELTQQALEDFMSQPELLAAMLQPLIELESDLRARAELAQIARRLYAVSEEDIPDQYRRLVEDYYRALSENGGTVDQQ